MLAVGLPSVESSAEADNSTLDDSTLADAGNSTTSVTGNVTVPAVRPKRITCLSREPEVLMTQLSAAETDVEYEDGSEPGNQKSEKVLTQHLVEEPGNFIVQQSIDSGDQNTRRPNNGII